MGGIYYMVEQVRVNPEEVRGYGNICEGHTLEDFIVSNSGLAKEKENVHGALTDVYKLVYSVYGLMFDFDKGNKQLYLQMAEADTLSFGFDTVNKQLYLVDENDTGFNLGFDEDTYELYITDDAPPVVHNYSIALDQSSYTTTGSLSVSATLLDDGVAVSGATVSFTGGTSTVNATTDSSGVATATVNFTSSGTLTATYSNVSDTATVTVQTYLFYDDCSTDRRSEYSFISGGSWKTTGSVSYDSTNHCYNITTASSEGMNGLKVNDLTVGNCKITAKLQYNSTNANRQFGIGLLNNTSTFIYARYESNAAGINIVENNATVKKSATQSLSTNTWYTFELIRNGTTLTMSVYNDSGTLLKSIETSSSILSGTDIPYFYFYGDSKNYKIKEAKVEAL